MHQGARDYGRLSRCTLNSRTRFTWLCPLLLWKSFSVRRRRRPPSYPKGCPLPPPSVTVGAEVGAQRELEHEIEAEGEAVVTRGGGFSSPR